MLRRHNHVSRAEKSVRSGGEHLEDLIGILDLKIDVCAVALADPVALHGLYLVRPTFKLVEVVEQPVSVIGDLQIPL